MICVSLPDKTPAYPSHHAVINLYLYVRQFLEILCLHLNKLIFPSHQLPLQSPQWVLFFFIATATVIIRCGGFTILTDPNFLHAGDQAHLGYGLTAERLTNPAIDIEELPPLDFCVLSHYHGDHFDQIAEAKLQKDLPILTIEHAVSELKERGFTATVALQTWESVILRKGQASVRVISMPGKHGPRSSRRSCLRSWAASLSSQQQTERAPSGSTLPEIPSFTMILRRSPDDTRTSIWHFSTWAGQGLWAFYSPWMLNKAWRPSISFNRAN